MITERTEKRKHYPHYSRSRGRKRWLAALPKSLRQEPLSELPVLREGFKTNDPGSILHPDLDDSL